MGIFHYNKEVKKRGVKKMALTAGIVGLPMLVSQHYLTQLQMHK